MNGKRVGKCLAWALAVVACFIQGRQHASAGIGNCTACTCRVLSYWAVKGTDPTAQWGVWVTDSTTNLSTTAIPLQAAVCSGTRAPSPTGGTVDKWQLKNTVAACAGAPNGSTLEVSYGLDTAMVAGTKTSINQNTCPQ